MITREQWKVLCALAHHLGATRELRVRDNWIEFHMTWRIPINQQRDTVTIESKIDKFIEKMRRVVRAVENAFDLRGPNLSGEDDPQLTAQVDSISSTRVIVPPPPPVRRIRKGQ